MVGLAVQFTTLGIIIKFPQLGRVIFLTQLGPETCPILCAPFMESDAQTAGFKVSVPMVWLQLLTVSIFTLLLVFCITSKFKYELYALNPSVQEAC